MNRRLLASAIDYGVILGWLILLAAIFVPLALGGAMDQAGPVDLIAFGASVLPVWAYLTVTESTASHGTWGKRRLGLQVVRADGGAPRPGRIAMRNAVKVLPWQLAHLAVVSYLVTDALVATSVAWAPLAACYALAAASIALAVTRRDGAALHDLVAGTRVVSR